MLLAKCENVAKEQPCSLLWSIPLQRKNNADHATRNTLQTFNQYNMETTKMKIEYRRQVDSETAPWQLLTNIDELLWNGVYALRVTDDDGTHNLPFRFGNDDTVTVVVKDHAHEGMLENGRTVVQTITRVDRTTGSVYLYTRTRYNAGGEHCWSYWTLAGEGNAALDIPTASRTSLGTIIVGDGLSVDANGKVSVAAGSIGEEQLTAEVTSKIASMRKTLQHAGSFAVNDGIVLHTGALVENSTPYSGTSFSAYTDKILSNGELLIANEDYSISSYKIFDGEQEITFVNHLQDSHFRLPENGHCYQFEFKKNDASAFVNSELPAVIKYFQRNPIMWSANSHMDNYTAPGTYNIHGDRTNRADGLPIYNTGSFSARLTVLVSNNCVTQVLTLLNVGGSDGNVYTRTRQDGTWQPWGKLQTNVEVGAIGLGQSRTFDDLTDNGIYSGANVYPTGTDEYGNPIIAYETFVLVVINAYLTGGGISQLKYSLLPEGIATVTTREKTGDMWSGWKDIADIKDGTVTAEKLCAEVREKVYNPLRPLYIATGAEYNDTGADVAKTAPWGETVIHKAGHYYLNGLGDITEAEMMDIYNYKDVIYRLDCPRILQNKKARTIFPCPQNALESILGSRKLNGLYSFYASSIEELDFHFSSQIEFNKGRLLPASEYLSNTFANCAKLRNIGGINCASVTQFYDTFGGCTSLEQVRLYNVAKNLSLASSSKISKASILYIVQYAAPASAITVTLHPDAYARLANDAEIVAALEAQPLVSLASA